MPKDPSSVECPSEKSSHDRPAVRDTISNAQSKESLSDGAKRSKVELSGELGRYKILKRLGEGAMGAVYLAHDTQFDSSVALKIPYFGTSDDQLTIERFYREARSAIKLRHSNVCPIYDVGEIGGQHFISMAFIEGRPLSAFIDTNRPIPERQVARVVRKIALALHEAHQVGIIHRDLKPSNIMFDEKRKEPIVMDFGLARQLGGAAPTRLTQSGMILGSPGYMSPEQLESDTEDVGPGADIYSLGVILYELLACRLPFEGTLMVVLAKIAMQEPKPPSEFRKGIDPRLEAICLKAMAKKASDRYPSMLEFAKALGDFSNSQTSDSSFGGIAESAAPEPPTVAESKVRPRKTSNRVRSESELKPARRIPNQTRPSQNIAAWVGGSIVGTLAVVAILISVLKPGTTVPVANGPSTSTSNPHPVPPSPQVAPPSPAPASPRPVQLAVAPPAKSVPATAAVVESAPQPLTPQKILDAMPGAKPSLSTSGASAAADAPQSKAAPLNVPATPPASPELPNPDPSQPARVNPEAGQSAPATSTTGKSEGPPPAAAAPKAPPPPDDRTPPNEPPNRPPIEERFEVADRNRNGVLTPDEYPLHIILRGDANKDHRLSRTEFNAAKKKFGPAFFAPPSEEEENQLRNFGPRPNGPPPKGRPAGQRPPR